MRTLIYEGEDIGLFTQMSERFTLECLDFGIFENVLGTRMTLGIWRRTFTDLTTLKDQTTYTLEWHNGQKWVTLRIEYNAEDAEKELNEYVRIFDLSKISQGSILN